ncbi:structural maintenance of chromosomes protein 5-like [Alosa pseudoharengus]|uniref:structural maintenance of chromosomes protein 5-like n=1 Tax=Alosa pseudoharengus TaxID=34774 RepID=UPI003F8C22AF
MKTRNQALQEIWSCRRATRSQGFLEAVSPRSTNDIKVPKRKRARKGKSENEEPGIMRDLRTALRWMRNNQKLFRGQVTEPSVLQMDEEERADALKTALESDYPEAKDPFLFVFQLRQDMDAFVDACADQQGLQISCMFLETVA